MPDKSKFCEDCTWWNSTHRDDTKRFGICTNNDVEERLRITEDFDDMEDEPVIYTEALFGCIYFERENEKVVTEITIPKK